MRGRMTRSIYSVSCSGVMFGFCAARYISANVLAGALDDDRVLGLGRQLAAHLLDLGQHLGQRDVGVGAELHVHADDAGRRRLCEVT